ncbi:hypothetical protein FNV43_RR10051 [Rhamnella rubrinervis]|uniref:NB-ARC domain-containing protein n=1 Tax=Rhamnella rubrinervis TaxID=2594499 RepID=A0A8K0HCH6_9ROSA|nr:hypothetical protein FNV43_RR10051 [Rhamnella rubrinervis]
MIEGLFGMTSRLKKLDAYVLESFGTNIVCFIGIHGMGSIGKSTLAEAYYKIMSHKFEGCSFLSKVREVSKRENGLVELQKQLLSDILGEDLSVGHVGDGRDKIRRSVIIVTTRNESLLRKRYKIFGAGQLDDDEALQLFSWKAFESTEPPEEYRELSEQVVEHANNLPLALTVFGSQFGQKRGKNEWNSTLRKLKKFPPEQIIKKLKISFDELDEMEQNIFLDIACFFKGLEESKVKPILDCCGFEPNCGIPNLICMSLLRITEDDRKLWMHDKLKEMGQQIGRGNEADQRPTRLWNKDELDNILQENMLPSLKIIDLTDSESLKTFGYFSAVPNLESNGSISDGGFPEYFGRLVSLENLVLSKNPFTVLPPSISGLSRLKFLGLEYCKCLTTLGQELPSSLEEVNVNYCSSLKSFLDPLKPSNLRCSAVCVDCFELVKIQDGILTAFTSLQRHLQDPCNLRRKFGIVLVGSKIPAWFTKPCSRPTISLKLGKSWCGSKWKRFALAVCFWADSPDDFCCDVKLDMGDGNLEIATVDCPTNSGSSNHLWLSYVHREQFNVDWENCTGDIEFSFRSKASSVDKSWHCGPWSVRLVYKKDVKMLTKITTKNEDVRPTPSFEETWEEILTAARRPILPGAGALMPKKCKTNWSFSKQKSIWGAANLGTAQDEALLISIKEYEWTR